MSHESLDLRAVESLGRHLVEFAETLSSRERRILEAMLAAALPPLERLAARSPSEHLNEEEQSVLQELLSREPSR